MTLRWPMKSTTTLAAILLLPAVLLANCTIKGTGSQRAKVESTSGSADSAAADPSAVDDAAADDACLRLAAKRAKNMKLLEDGEEVEPETEEETAACPTEEDAAATDQDAVEE
jgi:hypothetical protein